MSVPVAVRRVVQEHFVEHPESHLSWGTMCATTKHLFNAGSPMLRRDVVVCLGSYLPLVSPRNLLGVMHLAAAPHTAMSLYTNQPQRFLGEKDTFFSALQNTGCGD